jgi:uncharacterized protein
MRAQRRREVPLQVGTASLCAYLDRMTDVIHNEAASRYELTQDDATAFASYVRDGDVLIFDHTVTPPELRGRGVASRVVKAALDDVRAKGLKIVPACSFVADYVARHPEVGDLVADHG